MTAADVVVEMTKALAWPSVVFGLAMTFRTEITLAIRSMKKLSVSVLEAEFTQAREAVDRLSMPTGTDAGQPSLERGPRLATSHAVDGVRDGLMRAAAARPASAIVEAWLLAEKRLILLGQKAGLKVREPWEASARVYSTRLANMSIITWEQDTLVGRLLSLRNECLHLPGETSVFSATEYVDMVLRLLASLPKAGE